MHTNYPIKTVLRKPELSGRMFKWFVQISTYDVTDEPRTCMRLQALSDFVADFSPSLYDQAALGVDQAAVQPEHQDQTWTLYIEGTD